MARRSDKHTNKETKSQINNYLSKIETNLESNQSRLSMILGGLILLVIALLVFNYFNKKNQPDLGPAQQTEQSDTTKDVSPTQLPGKYTVKEGDTLFIIAEKYYQDGFKYLEIAKANNLSDVNSIEEGQVLQIPKLAEGLAASAESPSPSETPTESPFVSPSPSITPLPSVTLSPQVNTPQALDSSDWGPKITGNTYTVQEGDWLSTIAGRSYGDIFAYQKLAEANHIQNPDYITPGMVLTIPR